MVKAVPTIGVEVITKVPSVIRTKTTSEEWKTLVFAVTSTPAECRISTFVNAIASPTKYGIGNMHLYAATPAGAQSVPFPNLTSIGYPRVAS